MTTTREKNTVANAELNERIAKNLKWLLSDRDIKIAALCRALDEEGQVSMDRSILSKFLNSPERYEIKLPFLVACADYLKVSVDALVSKDIREYDNRGTDEDNFEMILDLPDVMKRKKENANPTPDLNSRFISDPDSYYFEKYYQTYYCYYYSTVSDENKGDDPIITGEMKMYPSGEECRVELLIDTKSYNEEGKVNYKKYIGSAAISPTTLAVHCSLRDEKIAEYCDVIFRYSQVNFNKQDCRMALILSTSSTPDKRYPVVHRMFMSREKIKPDDLHLIVPHLCLNYSKIIISEKELMSLQELSIVHEKVVEELMEEDPELVYMFKERTVKDVAEKYFDEKEGYIFLSEFRNFSLAYRYNKISSGVDNTVRNILHSAGYYQKKSN